MAVTSNPSNTMLIGAYSDKGKRPNQEDRFLVTEFLTSDGVTATLALVADGIGGREHGELASGIVQTTIPEYLERTQPSIDEISDSLVKAFVEANRRIYEKSLAATNNAAMGTTCTAIVIAEHRLFLAHVGDSRAYLLRNGELFQLTIDHNWGEEALQSGRHPDEIRNHPNRGVLKRFLGINSYVDVDTRCKLSDTDSNPVDCGEQPFVLDVSDSILLNTDGVSDVLDEKKMEKILNRHQAPDAARQLVTAALRSGASDNVTAVVLDMPEAHERAADFDRLILPVWAWMVIGILIVLLFIIALAYAINMDSPHFGYNSKIIGVKATGLVVDHSYIPFHSHSLPGGNNYD